MLTVREAAEILGVAKMTVYRLVHNEELLGYRIGRGVRIKGSDLDAYLLDAQSEAVKIYPSPLKGRTGSVDPPG